MKIKVILEPAEEGGYNVKIPGVDGCFTQGETIKEALENAKEALEGFLEATQERNIKRLKSKSKIIKEINV